MTMRIGDTNPSKMYVGDNESSKLYKGDSLLWKKIVSPLYLCNDGNECSDVTGGWTAYSCTTPAWDSAGANAVKSSTEYYLKLNVTAAYNVGGGGIIRTSNLIDLTDYSTLTVECRGNLYSRNNSTGIYIWLSSNPQGYDYVSSTLVVYNSNPPDTSTGQDVDSGKVTKIIDVSGLTGSYYMIMNAQKLGWGSQFYGDAYIYNAYLTV